MTNTCKIVIRDGVPFRETPRGELYSVTLLDCGDEIERLNKKCAALAFLLYGPKPPENEPNPQPSPCEHLRSELLARKGDAFEMRKCLDCTNIFRVRLTVKSTEVPGGAGCPGIKIKFDVL